MGYIPLLSLFSYVCRPRGDHWEYLKVGLCALLTIPHLCWSTYMLSGTLSHHFVLSLLKPYKPTLAFLYPFLPAHGDKICTVSSAVMWVWLRSGLTQWSFVVLVGLCVIHLPCPMSAPGIQKKCFTCHCGNQVCRGSKRLPTILLAVP